MNCEIARGQAVRDTVDLQCWFTVKIRASNISGSTKFPEYRKAIKELIWILLSLQFGGAAIISFNSNDEGARERRTQRYSALCVNV